MDHKERCKRLKAIRKRIADTLGIDLQQRECTFEGECKGTCPKCAREEKKLNRALASGAVATTAVMLTACGMENLPSGIADVQDTIEEKVEELKHLFKGEEPEPIAGDMTYDPGDDYDGGLDYEDPEIIELEGDVPYEIEENDGNYELDGDVDISDFAPDDCEVKFDSENEVIAGEILVED